MKPKDCRPITKTKSTKNKVRVDNERLVKNWRSVCVPGIERLDG